MKFMIIKLALALTLAILAHSSSASPFIPVALGAARLGKIGGLFKKLIPRKRNPKNSLSRLNRASNSVQDEGMGRGQPFPSQKQMEIKQMADQFLQSGMSKNQAKKMAKQQWKQQQKQGGANNMGMQGGFDDGMQGGFGGGMQGGFGGGMQGGFGGGY